VTLYGHSEAVAAFVAALLDMPRGFGECQAIGFLDAAGRLEAGVVYHNWCPEAGVIEITAASTHRRWVTRARLRTIFGYPFDGIGCQLLVARTDEHNMARRIFRSLGADEFRIPRLRGRHEAEYLITLTAETWREGRFNGQKSCPEGP
jgi:hypothetical protein